MSYFGTLNFNPANQSAAPGEVLTISGYSSATATLGVSANWSEDI